MATFGAAVATIFALVSSGGSAMAAPLGGTVTSYNMTATGGGLVVNLFGTQLTGAKTSASVNYTAGSGGAAATEAANSSAEGVFLTSGGVDGKATAAAKSAGPLTDGPIPLTDKCAQGGGTAGSPSPILVALGLGCAAANAQVDDPAATTANGPQAASDSKVVDLQVGVASILHQLASGGATQLCSGLMQIPTLGSQILGPACNDVLKSIDPTIEVTIGSATSAITSSADQLQAKSTASSVDVKLFPVALTGGGTEPLLEVIIPSAIATSTLKPSDPCTSTGCAFENAYDTTLIRICGRIIDDLSAASGGQFPPGGGCLEIPPNNSGTSQLQAINSSPLGALLSIDLADGTTTGNAVTGEGLKVSLLSVAPGGGIVIDTSGVGIQETASGGSSPATNPGGPNIVTPVGTQSANSPTLTHTGLWFAGSLPLIALLAAIGGALIGWPRLRRLTPIARLVSRGSR
ncbi:MAG: hypothetical protein ACYDA2_11415 [Acidimicrobiales bacterium]